MNGKPPPKNLELDLEGFSFHPIDYERVDPEVAKTLSKLGYVPFAVKPDQGKSYLAAIDPGLIPPTYCHSWALDLENITRFRLRANTTVTDLNFDDGDRLAIYVPETGQNVELGSDQDLLSNWIELDAVPNTSPKRFPTRLYIILRASPARYAPGQTMKARRMRLEGLYTDASQAAGKAWLVGDTLNHTPTSPTSQQFWLRDGRGEMLPQPWLPAGGVASHELIEEPRPENGWYLMARFTGYQAGDDTPIWAVVHYNEQTSRIRVHVWSEIENATGLEVRLKLFGQDATAGAGYVQLEGAFFDDDPRTQTWREGYEVISELNEREWRMVELGVLFPMAKDLPGARDASHHDRPGSSLPGKTGGGASEKAAGHVHHVSVPLVQEWYVPIYDSIAEQQLRNVRLRLELRAFTKGKAAFDFVGKGIGTAAQDLDDAGDPMVNVLKEAAKEGISAGKAGKELYDGLKEWFYKENGQNAKLTGLLALGGSAFGGIGAAIGAGIAIYKTLTDEGMKMELELRIRGSIQGSIYTPLATTVFEAYLPGRFDAEEMHGRDGIAIDHPILDQWIPRYDRPIGHVGFRYDPTETACRAVYFGPYEDADPATNITYGEYLWEWCTRCVWPAPRFKDPSLKLPFKIFNEASRPKWKWDGETHPAPQDAFIPLILNEFAEIVPVGPTGAQRMLIGGQPSNVPHQPTHRFIGKVGFADHVTPETGDTGFPKDAGLIGSVGGWSLWAYHGSDWAAYDQTVENLIEIAPKSGQRLACGASYWLDAGPGETVWPLRDFDPYTNLRTEDFGQMSIVMYDEGYTNIAPPVDTKEFLGKDLSAGHHRPCAPGSPWPIADMIYRWELVYLYYGGTRQQPSGKVPRDRVTRMFRAPVTLDVMRWDCDWRMESFAWNAPGGSGRSVMLTEKPWP